MYKNIVVYQFNVNFYLFTHGVTERVYPNGASILNNVSILGIVFMLSILAIAGCLIPDNSANLFVIVLELLSLQ